MEKNSWEHFAHERKVFQRQNATRMTERLYYRDSFLREFDAQVISCVPASHSPDAAGEPNFHVVLDRTAFYPTSGGQPFDTGTLGGATVADVFDGEGDEVVHVTGGRLELGAVRGAIDWPRRFDHMQQHTGQHLLSAIFVELFRMPTVSFHLGRDISTIDLAGAAISAGQIAEAERRANEIVFENRTVRISFGTAEELAAAGIRKEVKREGILRAIEIVGVDRQPCGGTHAASTGQIGAILLRRVEKMKGNWRVEFVCGERARRAAREDAELLGEASRVLGCTPADLPASIAHALEERSTAHRTRQRLREEVTALQAQRLADEASAAAGDASRLMVVRVFESADAEYLRMLAARLASAENAIALLGARTGGHIVFAQPAGSVGDMNALLREVFAAMAGKGGGTKDFAQGSLKDAAQLEAALAKAADRLRDERSASV